MIQEKIRGNTLTNLTNNDPSLTEHFTKLGKDSTSYLVGSAANRVIAVILIPLYTRYLTPSDYGVVALVTVAIGLVSVLMSLEIGSGFMRSYFEVSEDTRKDVLTSSMAFTAIWTVLILAFLLVSTFFMGGILGEGQQILLD